MCKETGDLIIFNREFEYSSILRFFNKKSNFGVIKYFILISEEIKGVYMGFGKVGINLAERTVSWVKTVGKTSVLQTKPTKPAKLNGLKYASELKTDTFVKKVESWWSPPPAGYVRPYCKNGKTEVIGHHDFHAVNGFYNDTLESRLKGIEHFKEKNPNKYKELYDKRVAYYNEQIIDLLDTNVNFTKLTPQPRDCVAYRGVVRRIGTARQDFDVINAAKIGDTIVPTRGFAYAAHDKLGTKQYLCAPYNVEGKIAFEPMLIEYRIPKGSQISSNMEHGGEVVFPALSKYKLISKDTRFLEELDYLTGNVIGSFPYKHVVLEYIPKIPL